MPDFFARFPKFYETSETTPMPKRLAYRHHLIIEQNPDVFAGKSVVEMASHDGRWAFAAIKAGAKSVHGVEARQHLVDNANKTFQQYGVPKQKYEFVCRDGFLEMEDLVRAGRKFDTGLVLGFLYHTAKPYEIIERVAALGVSSIVVDTNVLANVKRAIIQLAMEKTEREGNIASDKPFDIVSLPSVPAVELMLKAAGFKSTVIESKIPLPPKSCADYRTGRRFTIVGRR